MTGELEARIRTMAEEADRLLHVNIKQHELLLEEMTQLAQGGGPAARALVARTRGNHLRHVGQLEEALRALEQALTLWQEAQDEVEWARTKTALLPVLIFLGKHAEAIAAANDGLAVFLRQGQTLPAARLLNNMAAMYGNMGRPTDALRYLDQGDSLAREAGDVGLRMRMRFNRALLLQQLGRHRESIADCAAVRRWSIQAGVGIFAARVLLAGAVALFHTGQFGKALRRFAKARVQFESESSRRDVLVCDLYICHCYLELNRCDQALVRVRAVLSELDPTQAGFQYASAQLYQGIALSRLRRREEGLASLALATRWFEEHGHSPWAGAGRLEQAQVSLAQGSIQPAIRAAAQAEQLFAGADRPVDQARAALVRAEGLLLANKPRLAEATARRANSVLRKAYMPNLIFRSLHLLGRIALRQQQWEAARRYLSRAVHTAERLRSTVQVAFRQAFLDDKSSAYADLVWLHLSLGQLHTAHRLADRAKSRQLVDRLAALTLPRRTKANPAELRLLAQIEAARREYQELTLPAQLGPEEAILVRSASIPLSVRRAQAEDRLTALWDEWELRQTERLTIDPPGRSNRPHVHRMLPAGACMVEYFVAGGRMVAMVSDRRGLQGWVDLGAPEPVRRGLELLQLNLDAALLSTGVLQSSPGLTCNAKALLHELYKLLWKPLLPLVGERTQAVVIPHGVLHQVPFEALHDGQRYLVERLELSAAPSREVWAHCREQATRVGAGPDVVVGYNPDDALPYVDEEVQWLAEALGTAPITGGDATGRRLADAGPCRIAHLAVHGEFRADNPHFSTLLLADGPFTAADAADLQLDAALVVLSGCETGLSRVTLGEELLGTISAFLLAGSSAVLASRWRVDDRITSELMKRFYASLMAGRGKAASLQEAQAAMAARNVHPLYWAAFYLVGDGGPVIHNHTN